MLPVGTILQGPEWWERWHVVDRWLEGGVPFLRLRKWRPQPHDLVYVDRFLSIPTRLVREEEIEAEMAAGRWRVVEGSRDRA